MRKLILHIPHSSTHIPLVDGYVVAETQLELEIIKLTDWHTADLFESKNDIEVIAPFSRIFCDVERFSDDSKEVMSKFGMGMLYTTLDCGDEMRKVTPKLREKILKEYYNVHHEKLEKEVEKMINDVGSCLIIDCHSFPNIPLERSLDKRGGRPDINLGTDSFHTPQSVVQLSEQFFKEKGFLVGIDYPYTGSIVPTKYYQKNQDVSSLLVEVNRRLYLNQGTNEKSERYNEIKTIISEYLELIKKEI